MLHQLKRFRLAGWPLLLVALVTGLLAPNSALAVKYMVRVHIWNVARYQWVVSRYHPVTFVINNIELPTMDMEPGNYFSVGGPVANGSWTAYVAPDRWNTFTYHSISIPPNQPGVLGGQSFGAGERRVDIYANPIY